VTNPSSVAQYGDVLRNPYSKHTLMFIRKRESPLGGDAGFEGLVLVETGGHMISGFVGEIVTAYSYDVWIKVEYTRQR
jgi:hypothetical protein